MKLKEILSSFMPQRWVNKWGSLPFLSGHHENGTIKEYINEGYGGNPYVYMIVKKLSDLIAGLPYMVVDKNFNQVKDLSYTLFEYPNKNETKADYLQRLAINLLASGNAFVIIRRVGKKPVMLEVANAQDITIQKNANEDIIYYEWYQRNKVERLNVEDVWHIRFANPSDCDDYGLSPLQPGWNAVKSSNELFIAEKSIFKNRGINTILTNDSDRILLPKDKEDLQKQFNEEIGGASQYGGVKITTAKLRAIDISMTPAQMQLTQSSIDKLRLICGLYGVPTMIFGDSERSTYNNMKEAYKSLYIDSVIPYANFILKELTQLFQEEFKTDKILAINENEISSLNVVNDELSKKVVEEVKAGILTPQEAKKVLGYEF